MQLDDLSPDLLRLYRKYGEALHLIGPQFLTAQPWARSKGLTEWSARKLKQAVEEMGPPSLYDLEGSTVLVVPDSHAGPDQDMSRFVWLGRAIEHYGREALEKGVEFRVVWIGDTADYHSLSHYDVGKARSWGSTYAKDLESHRLAMRLTREEVSDEIWEFADLHWTEGNHEYRAQRYAEDNPSMQGSMDGPRKIMKEFGIKVHEFLKVIDLDGVAYVHYMQNRGTARAVSGVNHARSLVLKGHRSIVVGHSHSYDSYNDSDVYGNDINAVVVGCYFEHDEDYAGQSNDSWWRGLVLLTNAKNGDFDTQRLRMESVRKLFGDET